MGKKFDNFNGVFNYLIYEEKKKLNVLLILTSFEVNVKNQKNAIYIKQVPTCPY